MEHRWRHFQIMFETVTWSKSPSKRPSRKNSRYERKDCLQAVFLRFFAPFFLFSRTVRQRVGPAALPHSADDDRQAAAPGPSPQPVPQSRRPARPRSSRLHRSGSEFYRVLQRFRGLYWFYSVLLSFTEFSRVLRGFTRFYLVLPSFTKFYQVLPSFI